MNGRAWRAVALLPERASAQVPSRARAFMRALATSVAIPAAIASMVGARTVVFAQTTPIYRCGNSYSQWPCSNAPALVVDATPSASEQAGSARTAAAQARWAERLRAERLAAESHTRPALAGSLGPAPTASPAPRSREPAKRHKRKSTQLDSDGDFIAHVPSTPKQRSTAK